MFEIVLAVCVTLVILSVPAYVLAFYKAVTERKERIGGLALSRSISLVDEHVTNTFNAVAEIANAANGYFERMKNRDE